MATRPVTNIPKTDMMKTRQLHFLLALLFICPHILLAQAPEALALNNPRKIHLEAGQVFRYKLRLTKGEFASIKVQQLTVGIGYAVYDPSDSLISNEDLNALYQTEVINIAATKAGNYRVEIFWDYGRPQSGDFSIVWDTREALGKTPVQRTAQLMKTWYSNDAPGVAVAILKDGKLIYKSGIGLANMEYRLPITTQSPFELASCSKQFTGFAIATLITQGKIALTDNIRKYLPELPDYGTPITVEHLIYHTSGLRNWDAMTNSMGFRSEDLLTLDMVYKMICNTPQLNFTPGERFSYTNTGYNLLAMIVERVSGEKFSNWMTKNVFRPIGMKNSFVKDDLRAIIPHKVSSYKSGASGYGLNTDNTSVVGSTNVYASIDDLIAWVNYLDHKPPGKDSLFALLGRKTKRNDGKEIGFYAFGNGFGSHKGVKDIEHLGLVSGFRSAIARYPDQHLAIIFLANDNNDASYSRSWTIADLFLQNIKTSAPAPVNFPDLQTSLASTTSALPKCPVDSKEYEGIYYAAEINSHYRLSTNNGVLVATSFRFDKIPLRWEKADSFSANLNSFQRTLTFQRNNNKLISGFILAGADREITFKKLD